MRAAFGPFLIVGFVAVGVVSARAESASFDREKLQQVRTVLSNKCFSCHGPDESNRKAKLRLDTKSEALAHRESGTAIVPGKPDESVVIDRILSDDPSDTMPPPKANKPLTDAEKSLIKDWIAAGAPWAEHWAFVTPSKPPVPVIKDKAVVRNPIDAFVMQRLEQEGLRPNGPADRSTLIRRLYLDLVGLPPMPEEVDAFVADNAADATEKLVDRLLDSPHYGEKWAQMWLDAARYADSDGYEKDKGRQVWAYRDWVVESLSRDLPYNRFLIEQLAGDLLPNATDDQKVATGFLRNSMINEEGGIDPEQFRMEAMFDRLDAVGKSMLGLTIQCAQCHTHKYDPITQTDYYKIFASLNNCHEASIPVYTPEEEAVRAEVLLKIREIEARMRELTPDWVDRLNAWEQAANARPEASVPWEVLRPELDASGGQKHYLLEDASILAAGYAPTKHVTDFTATTSTKKIAAVRLELLNDPNLPLGGPGRSIFGLFGLSEISVSIAPKGKPGEAKNVRIVRATADANPSTRPLDAAFDDRSGKARVTGPIAYAIDDKPETAWTTDLGPGRSNVPRQAVFVFEKPVEYPDGAIVTIRLNQSHGGWNSDDNQNNNLGRFRFAITPDPTAEADPVPAKVREALAVPAMQRSEAQVATIFAHFRTRQPDFAELNRRIEREWARHPKGSSQLVLANREMPRETHRLDRGDFLKPKESVAPGVPGFLNDSVAGDRTDPRMAFALWIADRNAPTTARSIVNRVWQSYFGTGLVATSEDLGSQSEPPSHPELIDWLAVDFMDNGWSLKHLHRTITGSAAYRRASSPTEEQLKRDPYNRLLARGPRVRVDAEAVRDIALAASGLLNPALGGPSVFPPAPAFLFQPPVSYGPKVWPEEKGPNRYRRSLYTFRFRSIPYPVLQTFDAPNGDFSCVRRSRSNTPMQALVTLNETTFVEAAKALALKTAKEGGTDDTARATYAFRRCLSRKPTQEEVAELVRLKSESVKSLNGNAAKAWKLATVDAAKPPALPAGMTSADLAGWVAVSRVLLNLDETITKE
jgi:hypothetical protein